MQFNKKDSRLKDNTDQNPAVAHFKIQQSVDLALQNGHSLQQLLHRHGSHGALSSDTDEDRKGEMSQTDLHLRTVSLLEHLSAAAPASLSETQFSAFFVFFSANVTFCLPVKQYSAAPSSAKPLTGTTNTPGSIPHTTGTPELFRWVYTPVSNCAA